MGETETLIEQMRRETEIERSRRPERLKKKKQQPNGKASEPESRQGVTVNDFVAYMPSHSYIYIPTREMWPAASVNSRLPQVTVVGADGNPTKVTAGSWLDKNNAVEQMTWSPGEPMLIADRLVANGGWFSKQGTRCFNLYRPPLVINGDADKADKWINHLNTIYGADNADHITRYFAFKVQKPQIKINHALLLGGDQGIGKDTICEPLKYAVGPWNCEEISPKEIFGRFNGYVKSVILRINEVRDLGEGSRFELYEHLKTLTASPPDVLRVDEKHVREYPVFNVCGVIITTNYKTNGIYLPASDRRHYVAWSDLKKENFDQKYWDDIWNWYENGGIGHVVAYLRSVDISTFNPKAPPPKTEAFWAIVDSNRSPENAELNDAIDALKRPRLITIDDIARVANGDVPLWLKDSKNRRVIPHRLEDCGYTPVRNPDAASDGLWKLRGKRQAIYARSELSIRDRLEAVRGMMGATDEEF